MDQLKVVIHAEKRFGMAQKQISMRQQVIEEVLDHSTLRGQIEVDENVAAKNGVHALHECHTRIIRQIKPAEAYAGADHRIHLQLVVPRQKVLFTISGRQITRAVAAINPGLRVSQRAFVKVGSENFGGPIFERAIRLFERQDPKCVRFFSGGAPRAPDAKPTLRQIGFNSKNLGNDNSPQSVQLRLIAKERRFLQS